MRKGERLVLVLVLVLFENENENENEDEDEPQNMGGTGRWPVISGGSPEILAQRAARESLHCESASTARLPAADVRREPRRTTGQRPVPPGKPPLTLRQNHQPQRDHPREGDQRVRIADFS